MRGQAMVGVEDLLRENSLLSEDINEQREFKDLHRLISSLDMEHYRRIVGEGRTAFRERDHFVIDSLPCLIKEGEDACSRFHASGFPLPFISEKVKDLEEAVVSVKTLVPGLLKEYYSACTKRPEGDARMHILDIKEHASRVIMLGGLAKEYGMRSLFLERKTKKAQEVHKLASETIARHQENAKDKAREDMDLTTELLTRAEAPGPLTLEELKRLRDEEKRLSKNPYKEDIAVPYLTQIFDEPLELRERARRAITGRFHQEKDALDAQVERAYSVVRHAIKDKGMIPYALGRYSEAVATLNTAKRSYHTLGIVSDRLDAAIIAITEKESSLRKTFDAFKKAEQVWTIAEKIQESINKGVNEKNLFALRKLRLHLGCRKDYSVIDDLIQEYTCLMDGAERMVGEAYLSAEREIRQMVDIAQQGEGSYASALRLSMMLDPEGLGSECRSAMAKMTLETKYLELEATHEARISRMKEDLGRSVQDRLEEIESAFVERSDRHAQELKRELFGRPDYSLTDHLQDGPQPYSYGAIQLRNAALSGKPWMERLQDVCETLDSIPPFWHDRDLAYAARLAEGLEIEATSGELSTVLRPEGRRDVYRCVMERLKGVGREK